LLGRCWKNKVWIFGGPKKGREKKNKKPGGGTRESKHRDEVRIPEDKKTNWGIDPKTTQKPRTERQKTKDKKKKEWTEQTQNGKRTKKTEDEQKTTKKRDLLGFLSELQQRNVCCLLSNRFLEPNQQRRRIPGEQKQRKETQREHERDSRRRKFRKAGKERIKEQRGREARTRTTNGAFLQNLSTRRTPATNVPQLRSSLSHFTF